MAHTVGVILLSLVYIFWAAILLVVFVLIAKDFCKAVRRLFNK